MIVCRSAAELERMRAAGHLVGEVLTALTPKVVPGDPVLAGIEAVPDLLAYVATSPKPPAALGLVSHREDPVLATWRHGLGQSLAFTSSPTAAWEIGRAHV